MFTFSGLLIRIIQKVKLFAHRFNRDVPAFEYAAIILCKIVDSSSSGKILTQTILS